MRGRRTILGLLLLLPTLAAAQTVTNPTRAEYSPSADHSIVTRYEIGYFLAPDAPTPFFTSDLGKPTCSPICQNILPAKPAFGPFWAKVRAYGTQQGGGEIASVWSEPSNPFVLLPLPVSQPTLSR